MNKRYTKNLLKKISRIKTICIIISAISLILIANGCAGMRSVRGTKAYYNQKTEQKEVPNNDNIVQENNEYEDMLSEFETKFHKPVDEPVTQNETEFKEVAYTQEQTSHSNISSNRMPTLDEQMKSLSAGQTEIKNHVNNLQTDVDEMKGTLNEIKEVLYDMSGQKPLPKAGLPVSTKSNIIKPENKTDNNIILPDEKVNVQQQKTAPKPKTTKRKTNSTKPKENKTFTVKPVNYMSPDKNEAFDIKQEDTSNEGIEVNTVDANEKYDIAFNHFKSRRFNEAISLFDDIVISEKDTKIVTDSFYWLGESYFGMEQYGKAMDYFNKVSSSGASSKLDNAQLMIAECLIRSGQVNEAKTAFKELIAKYPDSSFVPRARKMLQQL